MFLSLSWTSVLSCLSYSKHRKETFNFLAKQCLAMCNYDYFLLEAVFNEIIPSEFNVVFHNAHSQPIFVISFLFLFFYYSSRYLSVLFFFHTFIHSFIRYFCLRRVRLRLRRFLLEVELEFFMHTFNLL